MKKVIVLSVISILLVAALITGFVLNKSGAKPVQAAKVFVKEGEFTYPSMLTDKEASYTFYYNEAWFESNAQQFNIELARMSIRVAMAATATESDGIEALLSALEFDRANMQVNYPAPTRDTIGYALAHKNIEECTLILCAVRGGGYKAEWADNFNVGTEGNHLGFETQAKKVNTAVNEYISENSIDKDNVKIWITGFSRGAATSNIAAHYLSETYGNDNVYAYCFECPRGVDKSNISTVDKNIFNIINDIDFITHMAPKGWDFDRYGITCYLPSSEKTRNYEDAKNKMSLEYGKIYTAAKDGIENMDEGFSYTSPESDGQSELIHGVFSGIAKTMSREEAERGLFHEIRDSLSAYYERGDVEIPVNDVVIDCTKKILAGIGKEAVILFIKTGMDVDEFIRAIVKSIDSHYPELCLAWMDTVTEADIYSDSYGKLIVSENNLASYN